jgi:predicted transcriptional regulator
MMSPKQEILRSLDSLPEEASTDDAIMQLYLLLKVQRGLAQAEAGQTISQEEARTRMAAWLH